MVFYKITVATTQTVLLALGRNQSSEQEDAIPKVRKEFFGQTNVLPYFLYNKQSLLLLLSLTMIPLSFTHYDRKGDKNHKVEKFKIYMLLTIYNTKKLNKNI